MDIAEKIKYLRKKYGLTLEQVGNAVGVGKSTVRKWETGQIANMRRDKIEKLATALHTTPAYLMGWEDEEFTSKVNELSYREQKLIIAYRSSPDMQGAVDKLLNVDKLIIADDMTEVIKSANKKGVVHTDKK